MVKYILLLFLLTAPAWAALPPQSGEDLASSASYVFEGEVVSVTSEVKKVRNGTNRHYRVKVRISKWIKGSITVENPVLIFCKTTESRPPGWAGPQGQNDVPAKGDVGVFYVSDGFKLLEPNGWTKNP